MGVILSEDFMILRLTTRHGNPLSPLGERVASDGARISRCGSGEGVLVRYLLTTAEILRRPSDAGRPETMKMIPLLGKEGSGVVAGRRGDHPPPPAPPPAEEGSRFQSGEESRQFSFLTTAEIHRRPDQIGAPQDDRLRVF